MLGQCISRQRSIPVAYTRITFATSIVFTIYFFFRSFIVTMTLTVSVLLIFVVFMARALFIILVTLNLRGIPVRFARKLEAAVLFPVDGRRDFMARNLKA